MAERRTENILLAINRPPRCPFGREITFRVYGAPAPQGSKTLVPRKGRRRAHKLQHVREIDRVRMKESSKQLKHWRPHVRLVAQLTANVAKWEPWCGPVELTVVIFRTAPQRPSWKARCGLPDVMPDADKLARAIGDALSGVLYDDDRRIVDLLVYKRFGDPGALIRVRVIEENQ